MPGRTLLRSTGMIFIGEPRERLRRNWQLAEGSSRQNRSGTDRHAHSEATTTCIDRAPSRVRQGAQGITASRLALATVNMTVHANPRVMIDWSVRDLLRYRDAAKPLLELSQYVVGVGKQFGRPGEVGIRADERTCGVCQAIRSLGRMGFNDLGY